MSDKKAGLQSLVETWVRNTYISFNDSPANFTFEEILSALETDLRDEEGLRVVVPWDIWDGQDDLAQRMRDEVKDMVEHFSELLEN